LKNNRFIQIQFGVRQRHSTIEQTHRIIQRINKVIENKQCCSTAFLDIFQAFDKVWHSGLLYKLRQSLPPNYILIPKSYLHSRHFLVKVETEYTELLSVNAGVPQDSVLGPLLYLLYTADLRTSSESTTATFADDTAVLAMDSDPAIASQKLKPTYLEFKTGLKMENESHRIQVDPCNIHYMRRSVIPGPYKQCATPPRRCQVSRAAP
jgi:hypothetical protein